MKKVYAICSLVQVVTLTVISHFSEGNVAITVSIIIFGLSALIQGMMIEKQS